ncbi:Cof-type HAD-IIB family hydrolase [Xylocopilactobacillus apis]|uniref:Hydrolase n=1 Tax=Xylocopilactobacillus apis TaxID=2932183 RepID=A0AAU9D7K0_9LACO|nr:Cof-type HAD-IIB family hydrolase [Xylocopilactobacillus apis]BDR57415.1 hydrolase [Xylocopilactobacillus apis]
MTKIKLVAIDIDDTLLNSKHHVLASTKEAVKKAAGLGVKVVLCSGRALAGVMPFLKELGLTKPDQLVATCNGGIIMNLAGEIISKHVLQTSDFDKIRSFCDNHHVNYNALDDQSMLYTTNHQINWYTITQADENKDGIVILDEKDLPINFTLVKVVMTGVPDLLDQVEVDLRKEFSNGYYIVRSMRPFLEIANPNANKGTAVSDLTDYLNLAPEEVMVIGDELNDLPMFKFAGTAVAMGNANPDLKEHATYVTSDNDHDGIAQAFEKFILNAEN